MSSMYGHIHSASPNHNWSVIETFTKTLSSCSDADCFTLFGRIASSGSAGNPYLDGTGLKEKDSDKWPIDFLKQSSSIIHYELLVLTMNHCSLQWAGFWCHELPANSIFRYGWHSDEVRTHTKHSKNAKNMLSYHGPLPAKLVFPKALLLDRYYARLPKEVLFLHHGALDVFQHAF